MHKQVARDCMCADIKRRAVFLLVVWMIMMTSLTLTTISDKLWKRKIGQ